MSILCSFRVGDCLLLPVPPTTVCLSLYIQDLILKRYRCNKVGVHVIIASRTCISLLMHFNLHTAFYICTGVIVNCGGPLVYMMQ